MIKESITSPTFPLSQHYPSGSPPLIHIDLYRIEETSAANEFFLQEEEECKTMGALMVVEWPFNGAQWRSMALNCLPNGGFMVVLVLVCLSVS